MGGWGWTNDSEWWLNIVFSPASEFVRSSNKVFKTWQKLLSMKKFKYMVSVENGLSSFIVATTLTIRHCVRKLCAYKHLPLPDRAPWGSWLARYNFCLLVYTRSLDVKHSQPRLLKGDLALLFVVRSGISTLASIFSAKFQTGILSVLSSAL